MCHVAESLPIITRGPLMRNGDSIQPSTSSDTVEGTPTSSSHSKSDSASSSSPSLPEADGLTEDHPHTLEPSSGYTRSLREEKYVLYVESLAKCHPSSRTVLSYMKEDSSQGRAIAMKGVIASNVSILLWSIWNISLGNGLLPQSLIEQMFTSLPKQRLKNSRLYC